MQSMRGLAFFILSMAAAGPMSANETAFLNGQVHLQDGSAPGHSVGLVDEARRQGQSEQRRRA